MKKGKWFTKEEDAIIIDNAPRIAINLLKDRSLGAICSRRSYLKNSISPGKKAAITRAKNISDSKTLNFVINGLNVQMDNKVKNVIIGLNSIKIDY